MKTFKIFSLSIASLFLAVATLAQAKTESIKVLGNCGMCETKIEKAAKDAGATSAEWDSDTKMLKVSYSSTSTNAAKIQQAVAGVGYDTRDFRAADETYNKLHGCCKYEREASAKKACCADCEMKDGKCTMDKACCKKDGAEKSQACCSEKAEGAKAGCCSAEGKTAAHKADKSCCAAH